MLNAKTARITRSAGPQNSSPSIEGEFVACFRTERRDKRRGLVREVIGWQGVTNFEESAQNCFGRILLPGRDGALIHDSMVGEVSFNPQPIPPPVERID